MRTMTEHRVVRFAGVEVYAARCWYCGDDQHTEWVELPSCEEMISRGYAMGRAKCLGPMCRDAFEFGPRDVHVDKEEAWRAREPERLERRLAELREGA